MILEMIFIAIFALCIGSFLNVCIYRISREESISYPPSHCTSCGYNLKLKDLVPILSYLFLGGKCRNCKEHISIKYPLIEAVNCLLYIMLFLKYGLTISLVKYCVLLSILIVIGMIDYETKFVYRSTIVCGVISGLIFIFGEKLLIGEEIIKYGIGVVLGVAIIFLIVITTRGMGEGDIEIAGLCGLFLGWQGILVNLFLAFVIGGIYGIVLLIIGKKSRRSEIAFGPFLVLAAIITIFFLDTIINGYMNYLFA